MKYNDISHFSHPQHRLKPAYTEVPFKCDGCKEVGIGSNYKCTTCNYDLHVHCALPSPSITHPFYTKCSFQFLSRPPGPIARYCNACEKAVSGFVYHCKLCGFDLHPCCAKLPAMLDDGEVELYLYRKVGSACHRCGRKGRSWSYRSKCKKYNLHVACVKEMLVESWHEIYFGRGGVSGDLCGKNGKLETRIPSLKGTLESYHHNHHHQSKGKVKKCCEMAGLAMQFVISAVLGDPTTLIAGVVGSLMSR
ncbi:putative kinase C-like, phorbol ester/diacylglycerol-binding protein [Helianthus annuus]|nr:putative kinase C-like, phorbol ester/diacylglycerol-binding protein [Helianthus annuus]KAJ0680680.1 putative kinase C-like, phorbol ester/diacylglycerol-binding protein [Helianthus annuus]